jgi:hypothetical protein
MGTTKSTIDKNLGDWQRLRRKDILDVLVAEFPAGKFFTRLASLTLT